MKELIILPAYNEAANICKVVKSCKDLGYSVLVVDDGSTDNTLEIAKKEGAVVLRHNERQGKGFSIKDGFIYAINNSYHTVITLDADGQHDPSEIKKFIKKAAESNAPVIIGNRLCDPKNMPFVRLLTNKFMSAVISCVCKQNIPDTQCGYRLFKTFALESITIEAKKFEIDSELLIKLCRKGYKVESIPIKSLYGEEISQINPIVDTLRFFRFLIKILMSKK